MLINGIELSSLGIELFDRVLYSNSIDTAQEWLDGDIQPTFIRQQDRFKTIKLEFLVLCSDEDEAFKRISSLTTLLKKATIKFDDLNFTFDTNIVNVGEPSRLKNGNFIVPYTLSSGYAKGQREIYTTNANMTNAFKLTVAYYKDATSMLATETVTIRASAFDKLDLSLEDLGINESGLDKLIKALYGLLGLKTFFTAGTDEVRAWTFKNGMKAPSCAGIIHSDFERGFIKAEVMSFGDLKELGSEKAVKEAGRLRLEGKEYQMQDGDICYFRFNVQI